MISNWVKECGIDVGCCEWCLMTEIANDRLTREVIEGGDLVIELALALTGLAGLVVIIGFGWIR
jgi:hypothetical protein